MKIRRTRVGLLLLRQEEEEEEEEGRMEPRVHGWPVDVRRGWERAAVRVDG